MVPAQLNVVTLGARDLSRLRRFYAALGWEVAIEADDFCAFQLRGALLALFPWEKLAADGQAPPAALTRGMRGFSLGINVDQPEQVDEIVAIVEQAGATVTKPPSDPNEFEGRHAYFADPEENYWEVVYLKRDGPGQDAVARALGEHS
jgi:catechol 2,3-dioxygenase-like lactoylglutathione lyase family enzyme